MMLHCTYIHTHIVLHTYTYLTCTCDIHVSTHTHTCIIRTPTCTHVQKQGVQHTNLYTSSGHCRPHQSIPAGSIALRKTKHCNVVVVLVGLRLASDFLSSSLVRLGSVRLAKWISLCGGGGGFQSGGGRGGIQGRRLGCSYEGTGSIPHPPPPPSLPPSLPPPPPIWCCDSHSLQPFFLSSLRGHASRLALVSSLVCVVRAAMCARVCVQCVCVCPPIIVLCAVHVCS